MPEFRARRKLQSKLHLELLEFERIVLEHARDHSQNLALKTAQKMMFERLREFSNQNDHKARANRFATKGRHHWAAAQPTTFFARLLCYDNFP